MANQEKEWVVMIYMAADNDLSDDSVWALTEINDVGLIPNDKLGVVALFDSRVPGINTIAYEFGYNSSPFTILPSSKSNQVILDDFDSDPAGEVLKKFVIAVQEQYPAKHYILILSEIGRAHV